MPHSRISICKGCVRSIIGPLASNRNPRTSMLVPASAGEIEPGLREASRLPPVDANGEVAPPVLTEIQIDEVLRPRDLAHPPRTSTYRHARAATRSAGQGPLLAPAQSPSPSRRAARSSPSSSASTGSGTSAAGAANASPRRTSSPCSQAPPAPCTCTRSRPCRSSGHGAGGSSTGSVPSRPFEREPAAGSSASSAAVDGVDAGETDPAPVDQAQLAGVVAAHGDRLQALRRAGSRRRAPRPTARAARPDSPPASLEPTHGRCYSTPGARSSAG